MFESISDSTARNLSSTKDRLKWICSAAQSLAVRFSNCKHGIEVHVLMAKMSSTEISSKNVTNELVQTSGRISITLLGWKRRLDVSNNFNAFNNPCNGSRVIFTYLKLNTKSKNFASQPCSPYLPCRQRESGSNHGSM